MGSSKGSETRCGQRGGGARLLLQTVGTWSDDPTPGTVTPNVYPEGVHQGNSYMAVRVAVSCGPVVHTGDERRMVGVFN